MEHRGTTLKALGRLLLLAALAAFAPHSHASGGMCRWEGGPGTDVSCKAEDCPKDGGNAQCTQVQIKKPSAGKNPQGYVYDMCDGLNYVSNDRRWCEAAGGTWGSDPYGQGACFSYPEHVIGGDGTTVDAEPLLQTIPDKKIGNPTCDKVSIQDSGWGKGSTTDDLCWAITPQSVNGINVEDRRERVYSGHVKATDGSCSEPWSTTIVQARWRAVECPVGYARRDRPDHNVDCVRPQTCCSVRGDPVDMASGARIESSTDYRFKGADGLELTRNYMSFGFFRPQSVASTDIASSQDYWRTNYDDRVYPAPSGAGYLADLSLANGTVRTFALDGGPDDDRLSPRHENLIKDSSGNWTYTSTNGLRKVFDANGHLSAIVSPGGLQTLVQFDTDGHLGLVQDSFGRTLAFSYTGDNLTQVTLPDGRLVTYDYDDSGRLTTVHRPDGASLTYEYSLPNFPNLLTAQVDESSRRTEFGYDGNGRAISTNRKSDGLSESFAYGNMTAQYTSFAGRTQSLTFSPVGSLIKASSEAGACPGCVSGTITRKFDFSGHLVNEANGLGISTQRHFDSTNSLETSRDIGVLADGSADTARHIATQWNSTGGTPAQYTYTAPGSASHTVELTYAGASKLATYQDSSADGQLGFSLDYDAAGRLTNVKTDGDTGAGALVTYFPANDECVGCRGQIKSVAGEGGRQTVISSYDLNGNPLVVTDAGGLTSTLSYDASGNVETVTVGSDGSAAETTRFSYDAAGRMTAKTLPSGVKVVFSYDDVNHTMTQSLPLGESLTRHFDADGSEVGFEAKDASGQLRAARSQTLDNDGRLVSEADADGNLWQYQYDAANRHVATLSPMGRVSRLEYDAFGQLTRDVSPDGGATLYGYDGAGNLTSVTDPKGVITSYAYDGLGRIVSRHSPDAGSATYSYDAQSRLASATDGQGNQRVLSYDADSRVVKVSNRNSGGSVTFEVTTTYDVAANGQGRVASVRRGAVNTVFEYDALGRAKKQMTTSPEGAFGVGYNYRAGQLSRMTYPDGMILDYQYDQNGRVSSLVVEGTTIARDIAYSPEGEVEGFTAQSGLRVARIRGLSGRIASTTLLPVQGMPVHAWNYGYDLAGRLVVAQDDQWALGFSYDANGNRTTSQSNGQTSAFEYLSASNRLSSVSQGSSASTQLVYDLNGAATSIGGVPLVYDEGGALLSIGSTVFTYDGFGRRIHSSGPEGNRQFVYALDDSLIAEITGSNASSYQVIRIGQTPIAVAYVNQGVRTVLAVHLDATDRVEQLSDSTGTVRWQRGEEDPFGNALTPPVANGIAFDGLFPGQLLEPDGEFAANGARFFSPSLGRYLQADPIGLAGGVNPYVYVASDPLNAFDPDGHQQKPFAGPQTPGMKKSPPMDPGASIGYGDTKIPDSYPNGTVTCDGLGGLSVFVPKNNLSSECISDCIFLHELTHLRDMLSIELATRNAVCQGQPYRTTVAITPENELWLSEIHAYQAEIGCLEGKKAALKDCDKCKDEIENALTDAKDKLRSYQYGYKPPNIY